MKKVLIDTNFLVECIKNRVDLFTELERLLPSYGLFVLDKSLKELEKIKLKEKALLKKFLERFNIIDTSTEKKYVDDILVELSKDYIICTQDKELKKRLKGQKMIIRQKKYLELKD